MKEKKQSYWKAPGGIPGVETMFPLLLDASAKKKISLKRVINAVCEKPSIIFGWKKKGFIKKGFDADLVIIDMNKSFKVENKNLFTKAKYSPFNGKILKGVIETTIVGGQVFG